MNYDLWVYESQIYSRSLIFYSRFLEAFSNFYVPASSHIMSVEQTKPFPLPIEIEPLYFNRLSVISLF